MESAYTELALYGSQNECAKTDNIFSPISEFCDGMVSLKFHPKAVLRSLVSTSFYIGCYALNLFNKNVAVKLSY